MDLDLIYNNILEAVDFNKSNLIKKNLLNIYSTFEVSQEITIFLQKLDIFIDINSNDSNIDFNYFIDDNFEVFNILNNLFEIKFVIPDDILLGSIPTYGDVVLKTSECKKYIIVNWRHIALFLYKLGENMAFIYCIKKDEKFDSMIKYFVITPYIYLEKLILIHGGIVNYNGYNYLITNESNKGKTTFTLLFWIKGASVYTEDMTYIDTNGNFLDIPARDHFNIRIGTFKKFINYFPEFTESIDENMIDMERKIKVNINKLRKPNYLSTIKKIDKIIIPYISQEIKGYKIKEINLREFLEISKNNLTSNIPTVKWFSFLFSQKKNEIFYLNFVHAFKNKRYFIIETDFDYIKYFEKFIQILEN